MNEDDWERLRHTSIDSLVTAVKLQGPAGIVFGWSTPEKWPFVVVVAIGKPGHEHVVELAREFAAKVAVGCAQGRWGRDPSS